MRKFSTTILLSCAMLFSVNVVNAQDGDEAPEQTSTIAYCQDLATEPIAFVNVQAYSCETAPVFTISNVVSANVATVTVEKVWNADRTAVAYIPNLRKCHVSSYIRQGWISPSVRC